MTDHIWLLTVMVVFYLALVLFQVYLLFEQKAKNKETKADMQQFKSEVHNTLRNEVNEIVIQNRELVKTVNKLIEYKLNGK